MRYGVGDAGLDGFARPRRDPAVIRHAREVREALQRRVAVSDAEFDLVFPEELRDRSYMHWTPVEVALRAAALLAPTPDIRVLDVGAGAGKMCVIGALATGAMWWGVEQDQTLVAAANHAAWALDIGRRTRFVQGDGSRLAWDEFDALYFFNPFGTLMLAPEASPFVRYATVHSTVRRIEQQLARTRIGTRVVTYHGFGGKLPACFALVSREPAGGDALALWIRV
jgi:predicted RNA methylase